MLCEVSFNPFLNVFDVSPCVRSKFDCTCLRTTLYTVYYSRCLYATLLYTVYVKHCETMSNHLHHRMPLCCADAESSETSFS